MVQDPCLNVLELESLSIPDQHHIVEFVSFLEPYENTTPFDYSASAVLHLGYNVTSEILSFLSQPTSQFS